MHTVESYVTIQPNDCVTAGEGKSSRSLGYQIVASGGILMSDFPTDVSKPFYNCHNCNICNRFALLRHF